MPTIEQAVHPGFSAYERRRSRRVRLVTQVESRSSCDINSLGHSEDISEGGMLVATSETIRPKTEVFVRFHLPSPPQDTFIEALGEVAHVRAAKLMGIRFKKMKFWDRKAIEDFVRGAWETATAEPSPEGPRSRFPGEPAVRRRFLFHAELFGVGSSAEEAWLNALQSAGPVPEEYTEFSGDLGEEEGEPLL